MKVLSMEKKKKTICYLFMYFLNFHFLYGRSFQIYLVKNKNREKRRSDGCEMSAGFMQCQNSMSQRGAAGGD